MNQVKNKEEKVVRLAKPVRKGLLRLVFSRFLIFFLLMLFQLGIFFFLFEWMNVVVPYFASLQILLTVMIIIYLFNSRMDPSAKLTWMWIIALMPMAGGFFLLFSRVNLGYRKLSRDVREQIDETRTILAQNSQVLREVKEDGSGTDALVRYLNRSGCFPVYKDTAVRYFPSGEDMLEPLLKELEKAEKFIFLEYFIIEEGYVWGRILDILLEKARAGVDVRVLYDGMCEMFHLPSSRCFLPITITGTTGRSWWWTDGWPSTEASTWRMSI